MSGTVSHFRLLDPLGAGGMGQVYTAFDTQLQRTVALKFVSPELVRDPSARQRLLREARSAAALNHSNVCTIHEVGEVQPHEDLRLRAGERVPSGTPFIAMELIEGDTLEKLLLEDGPLSADVFYRIAIQLAAGLEAAHQQGLVHRDLKPANLLLTPSGTVKILDFGLARCDHRGAGDGEGAQETLALTLTQAGEVLGTPGYMSPEQVRGDRVDWRTDIWAFGCILFELLTGTRAFDGRTAQDRFAAILEGEPDWGLLPAWVPQPVRAMLRRAMTREVAHRLQWVGDARIELQDAASGSQEAPAPPRAVPVWRRFAPWVAVVLATAAVWILRPGATPEVGPPLRTEVTLPSGERLDAFHRRGLGLSPDGRLLAFVASPSPSRWVWPDSARIYVRPLDQWKARALPGTENGVQPVFSPDGQWIAFVRENELLRARVDGSQVSQVCECDARFGASWGEDGTIVFAGGDGPLQSIASAGGEPRPLTELDREAGEQSHRLPQLLPDGKSVLFTALRQRGPMYDWSRAQVVIHSLGSGERKVLIEDGADARYVPSGHLVFARDDKLMAVRFDLERWEVDGAPVVVRERVGRSINTGYSERETGVAQYTVSNSGVLAFTTGTVFSEVKRVVTWVDRQGQEQPVPVDSRDFLSVRLSPDERQLLLVVAYPPRDVWLFDLERQTMRRQTFGANHTYAIWGPGPDQFTVSSDRDGHEALFVKTINSGSSEMEKLPVPASENARPGSWSRDGKTLVYTAIGDGISWDIFSFTRGGGVSAVLHSRFQEIYPELSPDDRWLVYTSDESGVEEVYACRWPDGGNSVQISKGGGYSPCWSRDGQEILYRSTDDRSFFSVAIDMAGGRLVPAEPVFLFKGSYSAADPCRRHDITSDGRLLLIRGDRDAPRLNRDEAFPARIQLVHGWVRDLEEALR